MLNFTTFLKMNKADDNGGGGGDKPPEQVTPATEPTEAPADGDKYDNFGYEKAPAKTPPAKEGEKEASEPGEKKDPATPPEEVKDPASGYTEEPPAVEPPATPPATPPVTEPDEFDKVLEGLPKEDVDQIKTFAKENSLSVEVAKKWGDKARENHAKAEQAQKDAEAQAARQRQEMKVRWNKELKDDKTFGGANFQQNVQKVEKVLDQFMPNLKKALTESKGMLPPWIMRDLAAHWDFLNKKEVFVQGDPPTPPKVEKPRSPLDFYNLPEGE